MSKRKCEKCPAIISINPTSLTSGMSSSGMSSSSTTNNINGCGKNIMLLRKSPRGCPMIPLIKYAKLLTTDGIVISTTCNDRIPVIVSSFNSFNLNLDTTMVAPGSYLLAFFFTDSCCIPQFVPITVISPATS